MTGIRQNVKKIQQRIKNIGEKLRELSKSKGKEVQKERRKLREEEHFLEHGFKLRKNIKGTKKGDSKGAFGRCRGPFDLGKALSPKEMKAVGEETRKRLHPELKKKEATA